MPSSAFRRVGCSVRSKTDAGTADSAPRDDRQGEPVAQPTLGVGVPARPPVTDRKPIRIEVMGDEGCPGLPHARRFSSEPLRDLRQLGSELLLTAGFALLPLAGLVPDRAPPAALRPRRIHRDPALKLDHVAAAASRRASCASRDERAANWAITRPRPPGSILARIDADCVIVIVSLPAFMQVRG